jgi:hypothetical protein
MAASMKHVIATCDQENKIGMFGLLNEKSIPFCERLTSIVRFLYYTVSQHFKVLMTTVIFVICSFAL